jgi:CRISPR-associated endonuclease/helicase Cas3
MRPLRENITLKAIYQRAYGREVAPYPYQHALAHHSDIDVLIAPTGLGKTAAVTLGWAWRRLNRPNKTPRRLVWCLPMRTLVEQTKGEAETWMKRLAPDFKNAGQRPPDVHILMGGAATAEWRLHPERSAILVGTQDMLLSRGLMRGYGMSRFGWPIDFGLLHTDALWVFDEVQLMGAGLATSAQIEAFRRRRGWRHDRAAKSLWVSATLQPEWLATVNFRREVPKPRTWRWNDGNPPEPAGLSARLDARKSVSRAETVLAAAQEKAPEAYAGALAAEVLRRHRSGSTTLVILNTVRRAQALYEALAKANSGKDSLLLIHSRFRAPERGAAQQRLQGIEQARRSGNPLDCIIVATQAIEAGIDMTSAVLFTELAPWSSLVQRFGRCNRAGESNDAGGAEIRWIDVEPIEACARPYDIETLTAAREIVAGLADAAPRGLPKARPPAAPKQVIRAGDFEQLFDTDSDLSGYDLDISPYIRDTDETAVSLFWRETDDDDDRIIQPRPQRAELCSAPLGKELETWLKAPRNGRPARVYVEDPNGEGRRQRKAGWLRLDRAQTRLRPGMVLLLDAGMGGYDAALGFVGAVSSDRVEPVENEPNERTSDIDLGATTEDDKLTTDGYKRPVPLEGHLRHVERLAQKIANALKLDDAKILARAARWHDLGKAYKPFQKLLGRSDDGPLLAKSTPKTADPNATGPTRQSVGLRRYFRHELASALAFLDQHDGKPHADLVAYLIAAHHGKVRMGLRALPGERADAPEKRIARGVQDGDCLPEVRCGEEVSTARLLHLGLMEMGEDEDGRPSWAARTQALLSELGPFRLAYLEALLRVADWRASAAERCGELDDE